jgi:hypothetical protein
MSWLDYANIEHEHGWPGEEDEPPPPEEQTPEAVSNIGWFGQADPQHDESRWGANIDWACLPEEG